MPGEGDGGEMKRWMLESVVHAELPGRDGLGRHACRPYWRFVGCVVFMMAWCALWIAALWGRVS